jgi:hypothetical protein
MHACTPRFQRAWHHHASNRALCARSPRHRCVPACLLRHANTWHMCIYFNMHNYLDLLSRLAAHRTPANLSLVSINTGASPCLWFAVAPAHSTRMQELCRARQVDFRNGCWWPRLEDLQEEGVRTVSRAVHRCMQTEVERMRSVL